ncbi:MAG TPA: dihydroorotase [Deltaproteobacteria bacterium]|nr:dihydroorotase [Deltaproteobacteria bacterium]
MKLLLTGGRVIDPSRNIDEKLDLLIENGFIARCDRNSVASADISQDTQTLDLTDMIIVPGLVDMHTHLREPGHEYKETILTGSEAAVTGGFTSIACMPNTKPVNDNRSVTEFILKQAAIADMARVYPVAAISRNSEGTLLTEFGDLHEAGAVAYSDDGLPVMNSRLMRSALEYAHSLAVPVISHCEDLNLSKGGHMNEGIISTELGLTGIPSVAEDVMVERDIALAAFTNTSVHIAHVSTAGSVEAIRRAKDKGVRVTAETAPHYFTLTDEFLRSFSTNAKMYPPLRSHEDTAAIKQGLRDGTIDAIASDHAPHSSIEKDVEFMFAASGIIGMETSLAICLKLVDEGILSLSQLIEKMTTAPAAILNIAGGTLAAGSVADVTVIDPRRKWTIDVSRFRSKSRNSPYNGWQVKGKTILTIVGGVIKYRDI